ncbi:hypothetical protein NA57DRAFT_49888 [Rhizodiscina lignyota]|uniref:Acyltransferase 3 domain-containing protein n=1 Tax=Rhizodiscina lignyota TaxID=1504668 RepID=A0A9P4I330_9PEZI|nr:hypothetical protein NA57DRAFT_49888 [Rhizodiscina lignyota]
MAADSAFAQWPVIQAAALHILRSLLPRIFHKRSPQRARRLHPTSYLDALRGYAAFFVINHHFFAFEKTWFVNLPIIRTIRSGIGMVALFFVISGYVLSLKLLTLARQRRREAFMDHLSSALFRRYVRLYLPTFAALAIVAFLRYLDWYTPTHDSNGDRTVYVQLCDFLFDVSRVANPFAATGYYAFNVKSRRDLMYAGSRYLHILWTIPTEFRASMLVYAFLAASMRMSSTTRMTLCLFCIVLSYYWMAVYAAMFLSGVFLAELSLNRKSDTPPSSPADPPKIAEKPEERRPTSLLKKVGYSIAILVALFLLSAPTEEPWTWYYPWSFIKPYMPQQFNQNFELKKQFWPSLGAPMLIWALDSWHTLQIPFNWEFSQYLGEISFGIYLMHIPVIFTLGRNVLEPMRKAYLGDSLWAFVPQSILLRLAILWAAEMFTHIDKRSVWFARWAEAKVFAW